MTLNEKLVNLKQELKSRKAKIMIIGLGSVGNYLLDYLMSTQDENIEIIVVGRTFEKMEMDGIGKLFIEYEKLKKKLSKIKKIIFFINTIL